MYTVGSLVCTGDCAVGAGDSYSGEPSDAGADYSVELV